MNKNAEAILTGYRVLDKTDEKGLLCGKVLGDLGADVIKVEPPGGDAARDIGPFYKDIPDREKSLFWFFTNTSKRSITLNLETADGRDIFKRLVKTAHFVIESFEPGYMAGLGLGYEDLEKINPSIIMTSITPFGQAGPYAHYEATDITLVGMGGLMRLYGEKDRAPLRHSQPPAQAFFHGSLHGALGSMVAHYHRVLSGEGQHVDVSCQQALILTLQNNTETWDVNKINYRGDGPFAPLTRPPSLGPARGRVIWPCKDGHVYFLLRGGAALGPRISTERVTRWANDEGFALEFKDMNWAGWDYVMAPTEQLEAIQDAFLSFLATKTKDELFRRAVEQALFIAPCYTTKEMLDSQQLKARDFWVNVEHDELTSVSSAEPGPAFTYPGAPVKMSKAPWRIRRRAPLIGEHNEEIYLGELGFSKEQLATLKAGGII